ncbi:hypothetical protein SLEP1_g18088 [Rubroshorea leprosula]|uniref:Uncharacterized protein n=1 Tax=Rubroshorea leprosula TaxID=152421 RepID=A0AAV5J3Z5_9ROSI|nr:hypothetical protein SLEP1_g18088 [Rubroshorea leprosula]
MQLCISVNFMPIYMFFACLRFPIYCLDLDIEINSRTYLQELFGSFPSSAAAINKIQDAETSDGEYQIYEQYSDGNFSDDDDS